jgi:hypothetical protein
MRETWVQRKILVAVSKGVVSELGSLLVMNELSVVNKRDGGTIVPFFKIKKREFRIIGGLECRV